MRGCIFVSLSSIFFSLQTAHGQSHGLQFLSHEVVQEKRTSLNLNPTDGFCLKTEAEVSFDLNFRPNLEIYFGYILRIITGNNENIDVIYNQKLRNFNFVIGEAFSGVFEIDSARLHGQWNRFAIRIDEEKQEASFFLNNRFICRGKTKLAGEPCYKIFFGANDFERYQTVDIPPMNIKDIRIMEGKKLVSHFPLMESEGNRSMDINGKRIATVKNPVWIKPRHQNWQAAYSLQTKASASIAFDQKNDLLYIVSVDSLYQYNVRNETVSGIKLSKSREMLPEGNQSLFDPDRNKLYNIDIDQRILSTYNADSKKWDVNFRPGALTVYWHANKFLSAFDSSLYIIGGYGQLQYKNTIQRYHLRSGNWEILQPAGDPLMPRYLAALGTNTPKDTAFILGGYGSASGDQTINPKHNYELLAYSVKDRSFHKIYQLAEPARPFCFANSLVVDSMTNEFYALTFPNDRFNSALQLIKGSLSSPSYQPVGDSIPYSFYDIKSFADLFYSPGSKKLITVTMFTDKNNLTAIKIYTIDFPPNQLVKQPDAEKGFRNEKLYLLLIAMLISAGVIYFIIVRPRSKKTGRKATALQVTENEPVIVPVVSEADSTRQPSFDGNHPATAVYLFGHFEVFDKNGVDITSRFTPLLKELFLLIVIYSLKDGKGISSTQLYDILWGDKPVKDARNNFSVNIVKLKHILEKVGECQFSKETGKWKFEIINDSIIIDYQRFQALIAGKTVVDKPFISELISIAGRGGFLAAVQYDWLDDIKSAVGSQVIDILVNFLPSLKPVQEAEFIIKIANCIFFYDQLNEEALVQKCRSLIFLGRHGIAREAYQKFSKEYSENYGRPFEKSFAEISA